MILDHLRQHDRAPPEWRDERRRLGTSILITNDIWTEVGSTLASLDHSQISPTARTAIREALERATGTKAP